MHQISDNKRKRAPSRRSLETHARIMDAAEVVFAARGFEGASIRDIADAANTQKALVSFHGGSKEELFVKIVSRRAQELAQLRLTALDALAPNPSLRAIIDCFIRPLLQKSTAEPGWQAYARLIAHVSADQRWQHITQTCFDPTAKRFINAIAALHPDADPQAIAACFVFTVSAMLSLCTSQWRVSALGDAPALDQEARINQLIAFCVAGMHCVLDDDRP
ncbi:MAG: AcrR family transcriptional regulator [Paracoccaceae bacterium]|jgi:AcrR family transcriptional regulator